MNVQSFVVRGELISLFPFWMWFVFTVAVSGQKALSRMQKFESVYKCNWHSMSLLYKCIFILAPFSDENKNGAKKDVQKCHVRVWFPGDIVLTTGSFTQPHLSTPFLILIFNAYKKCHSLSPSYEIVWRISNTSRYLNSCCILFWGW